MRPLAVSKKKEPMNIENYNQLISNLPVREQCFSTQRSTWSKAEDQIKWLKELNDKLFAGNPSLTISRQDIFETIETREIIIKTIYWGYPRGMWGNHFVNILKNIDLIESTLSDLKNNSNLTSNDFSELSKTFADVRRFRGLGLSTYSKLLYFLKLKFENAPCLILDQRLINVFNSNSYVDFEKLNKIRYGKKAEEMYIEFLLITRNISERLKTNGENIELFLFTFGKNLKPIKSRTANKV